MKACTIGRYAACCGIAMCCLLVLGAAPAQAADNSTHAVTQAVVTDMTAQNTATIEQAVPRMKEVQAVSVLNRATATSPPFVAEVCSGTPPLNVENWTMSTTIAVHDMTAAFTEATIRTDQHQPMEVIGGAQTMAESVMKCPPMTGFGQAMQTSELATHTMKTTAASGQSLTMTAMGNCAQTLTTNRGVLLIKTMTTLLQFGSG